MLRSQMWGFLFVFRQDWLSTATAALLHPAAFLLHVIVIWNHAHAILRAVLAFAAGTAWRAWR